MSKLLAGQATRAARAGVREVTIKGTGFAVAMVLFVCAFVFALIAIFHFFAQYHGAVATAFVMSLILALFGGGVMYLAQHRALHAKRRRKRNTAALEAEYKAALSLAEEVGRGVGRKSKLALPVIGLAVGFLLAGRKDDADD